MSKDFLPAYNNITQGFERCIMERVNELIHTSWAHSRGLYGTGIGVAVIDTGITNHPDFIYKRNRITEFIDFVNGRKGLYDDNGHGTHVGGILGGCGKESGGRLCGIAPECSIIAVKALNYKGSGNIPEMMECLEWVIKYRDKYNIRIMNISVGSATTDELGEESVFVKGVNAVWDAGIVVVAAAGNNGPEEKTIGAPGNSRKIITVGASDDKDYVELGGSRLKDYSSRGPTKECIMKPDIIAPGSNIVSCNYRFNSARPKTMYAIKSGTSMATPIVSGAVALLLQKYPDMTPREVKIRLKNRAVDAGLPKEQQGWGSIDIKEILR